MSPREHQSPTKLKLVGFDNNKCDWSNTGKYVCNNVNMTEAVIILSGTSVKKTSFGHVAFYHVRPTFINVYIVSGLLCFHDLGKCFS